LKGLQDLIRDSIAEVCGVDTSALDASSRLADVGVDSLASAEVLVDLEIRLGRQLPLGTLRRLEHVDTLGELTRLLEDALGHAPPPVRA
jgi:acyl carrier protein